MRARSVGRALVMKRGRRVTPRSHTLRPDNHESDVRALDPGDRSSNAPPRTRTSRPPCPVLDLGPRAAEMASLAELARAARDDASAPELALEPQPRESAPELALEPQSAAAAEREPIEERAFAPADADTDTDADTDDATCPDTPLALADRCTLADRDSDVMAPTSADERPTVREPAMVHAADEPPALDEPGSHEDLALATTALSTTLTGLGELRARAQLPTRDESQEAPDACDESQEAPDACDESQEAPGACDLGEARVPSCGGSLRDDDAPLSSASEASLRDKLRRLDEAFFEEPARALEGPATAALADAPVAEAEAYDEDEPPPSPAQVARRRRIRAVVGFAVGLVGVLAVGGVVTASLRASASSNESAPVAASLASDPAPATPRLLTAPAPTEPGAAASKADDGKPEQSASDRASAALTADASVGSQRELITRTKKLLAAHQLDEAAVSAQSLIAAAPGDALGYLCLGAAYQDMRRMTDARAAYSACVQHAKTGPIDECVALGGRKR